MCRRNYEAVLDAMAFNDSSSDSFSSSEEDDMDLLLCELAFRPKRVLGTRLNLLDLLIWNVSNYSGDTCSYLI